MASRFPNLTSIPWRAKISGEMELRYLLGIHCGENSLQGHETRLTELLRQTARKAGLKLLSIDIAPSSIVLDLQAGPEHAPLNIVRMLKGVVGWYLAHLGDGHKGRIRNLPVLIKTVGHVDKTQFHRLLIEENGRKKRKTENARAQGA